VSPGNPGSADWLAPLRAAYDSPAGAAAAGRAGGGQVVGVLGWTVPRELIVAAGMLAVRLAPQRVAEVSQDAAFVLPGLGHETARVGRALLAGQLDWLDGLVIGRDNEDYLRLFYVLRELRRTGAAPAGPPVAFFDLLRLPLRTSAVYNRLRARELAQTLGRWAGTTAGPGELAAAVTDARATAGALAALAARRTAPRPPVAGSAALVAAGAAQILPGPLVREYLAAAPAPGPDLAAPETGAADRVFVTGSGQQDPAGYEILERAGLAVVGEDHEWGDDGSEPPALTADPLDGIVDHYHLRSAGAARAGLRERTERTARLAGAAGADVIVQIAHDDDEAVAWELPALRARLAGRLPVRPVQVTAVPSAQRTAALTQAAAELRAAPAARVRA
jgi:hypothetical protein